jgi:hypothetical protein
MHVTVSNLVKLNPGNCFVLRLHVIFCQVFLFVCKACFWNGVKASEEEVHEKVTVDGGGGVGSLMQFVDA